MRLSNTQQAFLELVRAGLWEKEAQLLPLGEVDYNEVMQLAEIQSIDGLVTAGFEHIKDIKAPQEVVLQFIGQSLQIEQRNREMNDFIATLVEEMRKADIYGLLVKGSGLAQCYNRPLWRSCGDIDFFFSKDEYKNAVEFFLKQDNTTQVQNAQYTKNLGVVIEPWFIELHGTLRNGLSTRMDLLIDDVQRDLFCGGNVRSWLNGKTQVFLPDFDNDLFLVFVHFVRHFYKEGICLRQICDWCRLMWRYRNQFDVPLLEKRLKMAGLILEWKAFAALAVDYLGMNADDIPLYDGRKKWHKKGKKILKFILDESHGKVQDTLKVACVFPWNTIKYLPAIFFHLNWLKIKERLFLYNN